MFKKDYLVFILIGISSLITVMIGHHGQLSQINKIIFGVVTMSAAYLMSRRNNDKTLSFKDKRIQKTNNLLLFYGIVNVIFAFFTRPAQFTSFLFSPFYLLVFLIPLFYNLSYENDFLNNYIKTCVIVGIGSLFSFRGFGLGSFFVVLLFPWLFKKPLYLILGVTLMFWDCVNTFNLYGELRDTTRSYFVEMIIGMLAIVVGWVLNSKPLSRIVSITLCLFPIVIWSLSFFYNFSIFEIGAGYVTDVTFKHDTRSFLYTEMFSNMHNSIDWLFGKGVNGTYYSDFFDEGISAAGRNTIEVTSLLLLLRGGLLLIVLYVVILLKGVITAFKKGNNGYVYMCAIMISGYLTEICVVDYPSRPLVTQIFPFILVAICTSNRFLKMSNWEIKQLIK